MGYTVIFDKKTLKNGKIEPLKIFNDVEEIPAEYKGMYFSKNFLELKDPFFDKKNEKFVEKPIPLDELKLKKREELKKARDEEIHSNIEVHGEVFQVREQDIDNFMDVERALNRGYKKPTDKRFWILADNSIKEFTYEQLSQVLDEKAKRKDLIFQKFGEISLKLSKCKTVEEIEAII